MKDDYILLKVLAAFVGTLVFGGMPVSYTHLLREHGVHRGTLRYSFRSQDICNRVLPELKDLCWLAVNVRGCRAVSYTHLGGSARQMRTPEKIAAAA